MDHDPADEADLQKLKKQLYDTYPQWLKASQMITGTPKTIVPKLRHVLEVLRPPLRRLAPHCDQVRLGLAGLLDEVPVRVHHERIERVRERRKLICHGGYSPLYTGCDLD